MPTALVIGALVLSLTACTPPVESPIEPSTASGYAAEEQRSPAPARTAEAPSPVAEPHPCDGTPPVHPVKDATDPEQLGGRTLAVPLDRGLFATASGEATLNGDGVPVAYVAAPGDVFSTIAARFCLSEDWLLLLNHARRDNDGLYAGDTLNLDPHTIFSVGDQNGVVSHNTFPDDFTLPPQR
jgi:hypothetical protein